jgi:hypothetical protein
MSSWLGWALNGILVRLVSLEEKRDDKGEDWRDKAASRRIPRTDGHHQKPGKGQEGFSSVSEGV